MISGNQKPENIRNGQPTASGVKINVASGTPVHLAHDGRSSKFGHANRTHNRPCTATVLVCDRWRTIIENPYTYSDALCL